MLALHDLQVDGIEGVGVGCLATVGKLTSFYSLLATRYSLHSYSPTPLPPNSLLTIMARHF